jgi:RNA polymerase sigma-70 factor (ECF subfamily)
MNDIGEKQLIKLLRKDSETALASLFQIHHNVLFVYARQLLGDRHAAEDVVAESFMKMWRRRQGFESANAIRAFLFVVVRNACFNHLKQFNRHGECYRELQYLAELEEDLYLDPRTYEAEQLEEIWRQVDELPPMRKRIIKMIYREGLSTAAIAEQLGISPDTVRVQKARALHTIRNRQAGLHNNSNS